jgi:hypothetical protein
MGIFIGLEEIGQHTFVLLCKCLATSKWIPKKNCKWEVGRKIDIERVCEHSLLTYAHNSNFQSRVKSKGSHQATRKALCSRSC